MQIISNPERRDWPHLLLRPASDNASVMRSVQNIIKEVKEEGDVALKRLTQNLDGILLQNIEVSQEEIEGAQNSISEKLKTAIQQAKKNIEKFHSAHMESVQVITTMSGVDCWRKNIGIEKVGLYVPGGTAPLFSTVLMLGVPAFLAKCKEVILCTPCNAKGQIHPAILYTANLLGIHKIFKLGGAQAIAAMAYGTDTIPGVYKIFGPGNQYVTVAKQLVQMDGIAIDMPAGPSEVCILADETSDPGYLAADLLAQAEHGMDSQVILISTSASVVGECLVEIENQLRLLRRKEIASDALANSKAIIVYNMEEGIAIANEYAAEHLIIHCAHADEMAEKITNAGSVFIGAYSPESAGDYASGTNHTLPTNGYARSYSGVSVDSFVKKITFQKLSKDGLAGLAETVIEMAEAEGLHAHAEAIKIRL